MYRWIAVLFLGFWFADFAEAQTIPTEHTKRLSMWTVQPSMSRFVCEAGLAGSAFWAPAGCACSA